MATLHLAFRFHDKLLQHVRCLQKAHLLFVADGTGADLSAVDAGLGVDPRTGLTAAPAATAATVLQLVCVLYTRSSLQYKP